MKQGLKVKIEMPPKSTSVPRSRSQSKVYPLPTKNSPEPLHQKSSKAVHPDGLTLNTFFKMKRGVKKRANIARERFKKIERERVEREGI